MSTFDVREIFKLAVKIEENGYEFYTSMAEKLETLEVKQLFKLLAQDEVAHKKTFEAMMTKLAEHTETEGLSSEYLDYLRAYAGSSVFQQRLSPQMMAQLTDAYAALEYAKSRETDSILYYHEIKNFVPAGDHHLIDNIIEEERRHFTKLTELQKRLG